MPWAGPTEDVAGLDVGDSYIAFARMSRTRSGVLRLTRAGSVDCDTTGDPATVASAIRHLWRGLNVGTRTVCSSMHSRSLLYRYCRLAGVAADDEVAAALRMEAEEALQLPPEEIAMDWHGNPQKNESAAARASGREGVLVAVPEAEMDQHVRLLRSAGLYPVVVDARCTALANLFLAQQRAAVGDRVVCLTHLGASSAETAIFFGGGVYARSVHFRSGGSEDERLGHLLGSMQDVLKYFRFKLHNKPVEELVLAGAISDAEAACTRAQDTCGVSATFWNPIEALDVRVRDQDALTAAAPRLGVALGLALRGLSDD